MGNRAVVIFADKEFKSFSPAVYLHWNGGPESIYQFLDELDRRDIRADQTYECARFVQIVGEFMDNNYRSGLSLGVENGPETLRAAFGFDESHGLDQGVYLVCRDGDRVVRRSFRRYDEPTKEMSADGVETERKAAYSHKYAQDGGFREVWGDKPTEKEHFDKKTS